MSGSHLQGSLVNLIQPGFFNFTRIETRRQEAINALNQETKEIGKVNPRILLLALGKLKDSDIAPAAVKEIDNFIFQQITNKTFPDLLVLFVKFHSNPMEILQNPKMANLRMSVLARCPELINNSTIVTKNDLERVGDTEFYAVFHTVFAIGGLNNEESISNLLIHLADKPNEFKKVFESFSDEGLKSFLVKMVELQDGPAKQKLFKELKVCINVYQKSYDDAVQQKNGLFKPKHFIERINLVERCINDFAYKNRDKINLPAVFFQHFTAFDSTRLTSLADDIQTFDMILRYSDEERERLGVGAYFQRMVDKPGYLNAIQAHVLKMVGENNYDYRDLKNTIDKLLGAMIGPDLDSARRSSLIDSIRIQIFQRNVKTFEVMLVEQLTDSLTSLLKTSDEEGKLLLKYRSPQAIYDLLIQKGVENPFPLLIGLLKTQPRCKAFLQGVKFSDQQKDNYLSIVNQHSTKFDKATVKALEARGPESAPLVSDNAIAQQEIINQALSEPPPPKEEEMKVSLIAKGFTLAALGFIGVGMLIDYAAVILGTFVGGIAMFPVGITFFFLFFPLEILCLLISPRSVGGPTMAAAQIGGHMPDLAAGLALIPGNIIRGIFNCVGMALDRYCGSDALMLGTKAFVELPGLFRPNKHGLYNFAWR